jgi:hypothetical protein
MFGQKLSTKFYLYIPFYKIKEGGSPPPEKNMAHIFLWKIWKINLATLFLNEGSVCINDMVFLRQPKPQHKFAYAIWFATVGTCAVHIKGRRRQKRAELNGSVRLPPLRTPPPAAAPPRVPMAAHTYRRAACGSQVHTMHMRWCMAALALAHRMCTCAWNECVS